MRLRPFVFASAVCLPLLFASITHAFCGFYVAGAEQPLYNDATMVVLVREGTHTVLSMRNDYRGPTEDFAMVVPVPEVLDENDVQTLDAGVFDRVDRLASPRLVEYWEQDPCETLQREGAMGGGIGFGGLGLRGTGRGGGGTGVVVEAEFAVGEYEIAILSASDSSGLDRWLRANGYRIPAGAAEALRPYVEAGTKFFVARVDSSKVTFVEGRAVLSPLRIHYESDTFSLPVRLGMLNSSGTQDLLVHIIGDDQRYEVANYENVTIPTNFDLRDDVRERFGEVYAAIFDRTLESHPGAIVTEYAWQASSCDPCPGGTSGMTPNDLTTLGAGISNGDYSDGGSTWFSRIRVLTPTVTGSLSATQVRRSIRRRHAQLRDCHQEHGSANDGRMTLRVSMSVDAAGSVTAHDLQGSANAEFEACANQVLEDLRFPASPSGESQIRFSARVEAMRPSFGFGGTPRVLTRLHYRYEAGELGEDLVFRVADPIVGGRETRDEHGDLSLVSTPDSSNNFQARYAIRHEWLGPIECEEPVRGRWGARPAALPTALAGDGVQNVPPGGGRVDRQAAREAERLLSALGSVSPPTVAQNLASAPRGELDLQAALAHSVPALGIHAAVEATDQAESTTAVPQAADPVEPSAGCGCSLPRTGSSSIGWLLVAVLFAWRVRRS